MQHASVIRVLHNAWRFAAAGLLVLIAVPAAAGDAKGTVVYKGRTVEVKHAFLVAGPDVMTKQKMRRVILATKDLSARIATCKTMGCTDGELTEGLSINLEDGPRISYWMVMNDQKVQYSGTEPKGSLALKTDDAKKVAGTLRFDKTAAGGPKVDVEFDAAMVKEVNAL
ncbi:MAG: hypothetical protein IT517_07680 [Burkholderiales bacterium]|jgi:hypothetical protein|nr:hypothetical protein [Burkholderiales bacterium]